MDIAVHQAFPGKSWVMTEYLIAYPQPEEIQSKLIPNN